MTAEAEDLQMIEKILRRKGLSGADFEAAAKGLKALPPAALMAVYMQGQPRPCGPAAQPSA